MTPEEIALADVAPAVPDGVINADDVLLYVRAIALGLDADGDGLTGENGRTTNPFDADTDGDSLCDGASGSPASQAGLCVGGEDPNGNGRVDQGETDPTDADTDDDGLCDGPTGSVAAQGGLCAGGEDLNGNGVIDTGETDPVVADVDSDGDGLCDDPPGSLAAQAGLCVGGEDANGNGALDVGETNPYAADTDGDGLCDGPLGSQAAQDGRCVRGEDLDASGNVNGGETDPTNPDSDGDQLCDGPSSWAVDPYDPNHPEVCHGSEDPNGNGVVDAGETDPHDPATHGTSDLSYFNRTVSCPDCFALFVMPDIQNYSGDVYADAAPSGPQHLKTMAKYICANRDAWREPSTGKVMPIVAVAQEGDIVNSNNNEVQWQNASAAFDVLDGCGVPYMVVPGNHDYPVYPGLSAPSYSGSTPFYNEYFAAPCMPGSSACPPPNLVRAGWAAHFCTNTPICDIMNGQYFVGNGDDIAANSRDVNSTTPPPGPPTTEPGRHRAILVPTPNSGQLLIIGLDLGFDFDLAANDTQHHDDLAWVESVMNTYPNTPTVFVHHSLFDKLDPQHQDPNTGANPLTNGSWGSDTWNQGQELWDKLVTPHPQVIMTLNGHYIQGQGAATDTTVPGAAPGVHEAYRVYRNYQEVREQVRNGKVASVNGPGWDAVLSAGGAGWNTVITFDPSDPADRQIRLRTYRIDDADYYRTRAAYRQGLIPVGQIDTSHDGTDPGGSGPGTTIPSTNLLDMDFACTNGNQTDCPQTLPWNLP